MDIKRQRERIQATVDLYQWLLAKDDRTFEVFSFLILNMSRVGLSATEILKLLKDQ